MKPDRALFNGIRAVKVCSFLLLLTFLVASLPAKADSSRDIRRETAALLKSGEFEQAYRKSYRLIDSQAISSKQREANKTISLFVDKYPESLPYIISVRRDLIDGLYFKGDLRREQENIDNLYDHRMISLEERKELSNYLTASITEKHATGRLVYLLTDDWQDISGLNTPESIWMIFERSVLELLNAPVCCELLEAVLEHVRNEGVDSTAHKWLESRLKYMSLPMSLLREEILDLYPDFASQVIRDRQISIHITTENSDDFVVFDLRDRLESEPDFKLVEEDSEAEFTLSLQDLKILERQLPERTQTVRYERHQVNLVSGALFMPKYSSYVFDQVSGGAQIRYSGAVSIIVDGKVENTRRISEKVELHYSYCVDERIVNAFGGVQPANFAANADYNQRCSSETKEVDSDDLYRQVIDELFRELREFDELTVSTDPIEVMVFEKDDQVLSSRATKQPGVSGEDIHEGLSGATLGPATRGLLVSSVMVGSAAYELGIREGDVITAANQLSISSVEELSARMAQYEIPALLVYRAGQPRLVRIRWAGDENFNLDSR